MKIRLLIFLLSALNFIGCASVHSDHKAVHKEGDQIDGLIVSAEELTDPSEEAFSMITVNFENKTDHWMRIDKVDVIIGKDLADKVSVVLGQDLVDWSSAMEARAQVERHNRQMTQLSLAYLGAAAAMAGAYDRDRTTTIAGAASVSASQVWVISDAIRSSRKIADNPKTIPQNHLNRRFSVPGKLFLRRWVLLNKPVGVRITELPLKITMVDGRTTTMLVNLKGASL